MRRFVASLAVAVAVCSLPDAMGALVSKGAQARMLAFLNLR